MWFLNPPNSRRRWHVFTWLAAVPALVFVALVQVAGVYDPDENRLIQTAPRWYYLPHPDARYPLAERGDPPDFDADIDTQFNRLPEIVGTYQHGWPTPWLHRELGFGPGRWRSHVRSSLLIDYLDDNHGREWPLGADAWQVAPVGLLVNLLVAVAVVALPMLATETWLRRRGGLGRFKIIDFLVVVAVVAAGFGFWRWDRGAVEREQKLVDSQIMEFGQLGTEELETNYVGPDWIERLLGPGKVPIFRRHVRLRANASDFRHREIHHLDCEALALLPYLKSVEINCDFFETAPNDFRLADLTKLSQVRELTLQVPGNNALTIFFSSGDPSQLSQITSLTIDGDDVSPATLLPARQLPNLRELHIRTDWYYEEELAELERSFQGAKIVALGDPRLPPYRREQITVRRWGLGCELSNDGRSLALTADINFPAERLQEIRRVLSKVEKLTLHARWIDSEMCEQFAKMPSLEVLTLNLLQFPENFTDAVAAHPNLRRLRFEYGKPPLASLLLLKAKENLTLSFSPVAWKVGDQHDAFRETFGDRIEIGSP